MNLLREIRVSKFDAGQRLDVFISKSFPDITRSHAKKLIDEERVKVSGVARRASYLVHGGEDVAVLIPTPARLPVEPESIPLNILYEDEDIIVVDKKSGMVVHPAANVSSGTLVNALLSHCKDLSGIGGVKRPGIVHRLDKGTSGVMLVAKNDFAHNHISRQFKDRSIEKEYLALVYGKIPSERGMVESPIGRHASDRKRMSTKTKRGREASTEWIVRERFGDHLTLLDIKLHTGRTHQIRVHLSSIGHPVVGDDLYGGSRVIKRIPKGDLQERIKLVNRPVLHARLIKITHPRKGERMSFVAPIPVEIEELLKDIRTKFRP